MKQKQTKVIVGVYLIINKQTKHTQTKSSLGIYPKFKQRSQRHRILTLHNINGPLSFSFLQSSMKCACLSQSVCGSQNSIYVGMPRFEMVRNKFRRTQSHRNMSAVTEEHIYIDHQWLHPNFTTKAKYETRQAIPNIVAGVYCAFRRSVWVSLPSLQR